MKTKIFRSEKGSAILLIMVMIGVIGVFSMTVVDLITTSRHHTAVSKNYVNYQNALNSMLDYSLYAVKQRWCLTPEFTQDSVNCDFSHPRNTERLVLTDKAVAAVAEFVRLSPSPPAGWASPFRIRQIDVTVPIASITNIHPLFTVIQGIRNSQAITDVRFRIRRVDSKHWPHRGRESFIRVDAELSGPTMLLRGLNTIRAHAMVVVFPRELGMFSLVVPGDLRLDLTSSNSAQGNANIAMFASRAAAGETLRFESPVFVNRDIVLPAASPTNFGGATFVAQAILGGGSPGGRILRGADPMQPPSLGDEADRFYDQINEFGGFLQGIDIDGFPDEGLLKFAGLASVTAPTLDETRECIELSEVKSALWQTSRSRLVARNNGVNATTGMTIGFDLGLSQKNLFIPQKMTFGSGVAHTPGAFANPQPRLSPAPVPGAPYRPVVYVLLDFDAHTVGATSYPAKSARGFIALGGTFRMRLPDPAGGANRPFLEVRALPVNFGTGAQPNQVRLEFAVTGGNAASVPPFNVTIRPMDVGMFSGHNRRQIDPPIANDTTGGHNDLRALVGRVTTAATGLTLVTPALGAGWSHSAPATFDPTIVLGTMDGLPNLTKDYRAVMTECESDRSDRGQAFGVADWATASFTEGTRVSWNFADPTPSWSATYPNPADTFLIDDTNHLDFHIKSIRRTCSVSSTALFVAGFLGCDEFVIQARATPLTIVGTVIAARTDIHPSAISAGITWRSIYHPQSVLDLRERGILRPFDETSLCNNIPAEPVWHPQPSMANLVGQFTCNPISLRRRADPFTWTTVDPDCGTAGGRFMECKNRPRRFLVREIYRAGDL